jgi:hypothetical protein
MEYVVLMLSTALCYCYKYIHLAPFYLITHSLPTFAFTMLQIGSIQLPHFPLLLAPMEDVSDPPFRAVCKMNGADLMYTEFNFTRI